MRVKIKDIDKYNSQVFGAECLLRYFPELQTTGVEVRLINKTPRDGIPTNFYYILKDGNIVNQTCFFSEEELLNTLEII